jgi:hypothetical protein
MTTDVTVQRVRPRELARDALARSLRQGGPDMGTALGHLGLAVRIERVRALVADHLGIAILDLSPLHHVEELTCPQSSLHG